MAPSTKTKKKAAPPKTKTKTVPANPISPTMKRDLTAQRRRSSSPTITDEHEADGTHVGNVIDLDTDSLMELDDKPDDIEIADEQELGACLTMYGRDQSDSRGTIEKLLKEWTAPVYVFFAPRPSIEYVDGRRCHTFQCAAKPCKMRERIVRRFLDKGDAKSTGNLRKHARKCWGEDVVASADNAQSADDVRHVGQGGKLAPGLITAAFARAGKGKVSYSHIQHTRTEAR
jgi:hypothetical protein